MKLRINNYDFTVAEDEESKLVFLLMDFLISKYQKMPSWMRNGAKLFVRTKVLEPMECQIREAYGREESLKIRPVKGADPVIHAANLFLPKFRQEIANVTLECTIEDGTDSITNIAIATAHQDQSG